MQMFNMTLDLQNTQSKPAKYQERVEVNFGKLQIQYIHVWKDFFYTGDEDYQDKNPFSLIVVNLHYTSKPSHKPPTDVPIIRHHHCTQTKLISPKHHK